MDAVVAALVVSIRRADDWAFEQQLGKLVGHEVEFQSAGRMIGLLNRFNRIDVCFYFRFQSAGRMIGLLNRHARRPPGALRAVSIRRADDWAFERMSIATMTVLLDCFNPPGG